MTFKEFIETLLSILVFVGIGLGSIWIMASGGIAGFILCLAFAGGFWYLIYVSTIGPNS
jgi:hypothetical protein